jgi:tyrosyl-tRNA synthetase
LKVNDVAVGDPRAAISRADFNADGVAKLSLGKKKHILLKLV